MGFPKPENKQSHWRRRDMNQTGTRLFPAGLAGYFIAGLFAHAFVDGRLLVFWLRAVCWWALKIPLARHVVPVIARDKAVSVAVTACRNEKTVFPWLPKLAWLIDHRNVLKFITSFWARAFRLIPWTLEVWYLFANFIFFLVSERRWLRITLQSSGLSVTPGIRQGEWTV